MNSVNFIVGLFILIFILGCQESNSVLNSSVKSSAVVSINEEPLELNDSIQDLLALDIDTTKWVDLSLALNYAHFDIRYATIDNFTGKQIYDCPACYIRKELAAEIIRVEQQANAMGFGLLIYDCYRPSGYQQRLWEAMPDRRYVMHPSKGSNHSRGVAIDLTLFALESDELLDMGTDFDHLGMESHRDYANLSETAIVNREILLQLMTKNNFRSIRTEWWHFDYKNRNFPLESFMWNCD